MAFSLHGPMLYRVSQLSSVCLCKPYLRPSHHDEQASLASNACHNTQRHSCSLQDWSLLHVDFYVPVASPARLSMSYDTNDLTHGTVKWEEVEVHETDT